MRARTWRSPKMIKLVPRSPYALSKLAQEMVGQHAMSDELHVTIARAFNHVGPRQDPHFAASGFARRIADIEAGRWEAEIAVGNLNARRDLTDVRDTVRAYRLILERGESGRAYNVCSGHAISIGDLLDMLLARARVADSRSCRHRPLPPERHTVPRRRLFADLSGARLAPANPARPHPRRSARVLAGTFDVGGLTRRPSTGASSVANKQRKCQSSSSWAGALPRLETSPTPLKKVGRRL